MSVGTLKGLLAAGILLASVTAFSAEAACTYQPFPGGSKSVGTSNRDGGDRWANYGSAILVLATDLYGPLQNYRDSAGKFCVPEEIRKEREEKQKQQDEKHSGGGGGGGGGGGRSSGGGGGYIGGGGCVYGCKTPSVKLGDVQKV